MRIYTNDGMFTLLEPESLLDGLLRRGYAVEYQCRSGFCGTCKLKFTTGSFTYPQPPIAFLAPDEVLPCCCVLSEPITLDLDRAEPIPDPLNDELNP